MTVREINAACRGRRGQRLRKAAPAHEPDEEHANAHQHRAH